MSEKQSDDLIRFKKSISTPQKEKLSSADGEHKSSIRFTLIELLVVIAIIAILAAILLPALQSARQRGHSTGCTNNIKNFGMGTLNYAQDFEGYMPVYGSYPWLALRGYGMFKSYNIKTGSPPKLYDSVFFCPQIYKRPTHSFPAGRSYYVWPKWSHYGAGAGNIRRVNKPAQKFLLVESAIRYRSATSSELTGGSSIRYFDHSMLTFPHKEMMSIFHWDGHVAMYANRPIAFFPSNTTANNKTTRFNWDFTY